MYAYMIICVLTMEGDGVGGWEGIKKNQNIEH